MLFHLEQFPFESTNHSIPHSQSPKHLLKSCCGSALQ